jgi:hypothetical protein
MAEKSEKEKLAEQGAADVAEGLDTLEAAADVADVGRAALAAGASDVTRGVDAMVVADRVTKLSDIVEAAGVTDVAEGLEIVEDLQAALEQFSEIAEDLEAGNGSGDQILQ